MHCVEYKSGKQDLTDNQLCMRNILIKAGIHYQLVLIINDKPKIVFDSYLHSIK